MDRIEPLRLFIRLSERGSFSAAARDLRIKQSTASKWIAELENQLGVTLIERTTRSLRLTDAGRRLQQRATDIVAAVDAIADGLPAQTAQPMGRIRLSVPVVFGRIFLVPLVAQFMARHPRVEAEVVLSDRYVNLVEEGFDLAVRVGVPTDTSARGHKLADSERRLVASPDYLVGRQRPASPKELETHDCLVHGDLATSSLWRFRKGKDKERPVSVKARFVTNNSEAALDMARAGLGIALLADWLVAEDLAQKRLVRLLEDYATPPAPVYAITPPGRYIPSTVRAFLAHLKTSLHV